MSITKTETISEEAYRQFALGDPSGQWELHHGQLREKPGMSVEHGDIMMVLAALLHNQLDRNVFRVRAHHARLRRSADTYYVPDIAIIPTPMERALRETIIDGVTHVTPLHQMILADEGFRSGDIHTGFVSNFLERSFHLVAGAQKDVIG